MKALNIKVIPNARKNEVLEEGGMLNVYVNAAAIKDEAFVHERISELNAILTGKEVATEEIYQEVRSRL